MTFWTYLFIVVGVVVVTSQFFRLIDFIERPNPRRSRHRIQRAA